MKKLLYNNTILTARYGVATLLLLLFFNWGIVAAVQFFRYGVLDASALQVGEWPWWLGVLVAVGNLWILAVMWWHYQQASSLNHLLQDLQQRGNKVEQAIDRQTPYAPQTQALIDVVNDMAVQTTQMREEERQSEASKDEMITNISHDLRTPLTAIIGYLGLVEMQGAQLDDQARDKYVHTAYEKANHMKTLVEDLFEYSKTQARDAQLNINTISLGDLFAQLAASYEIEAHEKQLALTQITHPELLIMEADSDKLARALINLVTNALKYGHGASFIKLTGQVRDDEVEIRVVNDGEQIPQEALGDLFDRFYRVESSRNTETGGTGLGLAIVKGIVEQHHGTIYAESSADITSFIMRLPLKQPAQN